MEIVSGGSEPHREYVVDLDDFRLRATPGLFRISSLPTGEWQLLTEIPYTGNDGEEHAIPLLRANIETHPSRCSSDIRVTMARYFDGSDVDTRTEHAAGAVSLFAAALTGAEAARTEYEIRAYAVPFDVPDEAAPFNHPKDQPLLNTLVERYGFSQSGAVALRAVTQDFLFRLSTWYGADVEEIIRSEASGQWRELEE